jgi:hypothetical protein
MSAIPAATARQSWRFASRFLADYRRNPVNLLLLILVPTAFVVVAARSMADAAELLGGPGGPMMETNTAGWAAGFLAGIAMYYQVAGARDVDRRLVLCGLPAWRIVSARLLTGLILAVLVSLTALVALALRTGIEEPGRALAGTLMFALIYLALGAVVGALVRDAVNGTVLILFVWILDVFFGPALGSSDRLATRGLPTHFVSLFMIDLPSRHGGQIGDLGWALAWTAGALVLAFVTVMATSRIAKGRRRADRPNSFAAQVGTGLRLGLRGQARNPVLWALLAIVPAVFILLSDAVTPDRPTTLRLREGGRAVVRVFSLMDIHAGTMTPIAIASLAALVGLFTLLDARAGDRRLALAGYRPTRTLTVRLGLVTVATAFATAASLAVTALVFRPDQQIIYVAANLVIAATYALIGVLLAPLFGRVGGVFLAFLVPFLDLGIAQSPMLRDQPPEFAHYLPGYGASRMLVDSALTDKFDESQALMIAVAWLGFLALTAAAVIHSTARSVTKVPATSLLAIYPGRVSGSTLKRRLVR